MSIILDGSAGITAPNLSSTETAKIPTIVATVAINALTIGLAPLYLDFRSSTLNDGTVTTVLAGPASITIPSTATIGTADGVASRLVIIALLNAGLAELAVVNLAGGNNLDETTSINTTALGVGSTSTNVIYSTTARVNVPFRVVGFIDITEATAGTWAAGPTAIQGAGGQAIAAMNSLGYGQSWTGSLAGASRVLNGTYYNVTGRPIMVLIRGHSATANSQMFMVVNGLSYTISIRDSAATTGYQVGSMIIPPGSSYQLTMNGTSPALDIWYELT